MDTTADELANGNHFITSGRKIPAIPSAKYRPIPTPMPASWLRAIVAIAYPKATFMDTPSPARANSSGMRPSASASPMPSSETPMIVAPTAAPATPTRNASTSPMMAKIATPTKPAIVYRARLSPRATAALSVPHAHSDPAMAAPYSTASSPPMPRTMARISS